MVALGEVGIILSREVSRLSRTDTDWCRLLEVCQVFATLIADTEQVYDLNLVDDQLMLGIKGTLSVVELHTLRLRMQAGREAKACRGELLMLLPPGYVVTGRGKVEKDPDLRVQEAIGIVFTTFDRLGSIRQTYLWFREQEIELPVNKPGEQAMYLLWQLPTYAFTKDVLQNPYYAGAYVWGRRQVQKRVEGAQVRKRNSKILQPEECRVFIKDHHEGYIDWSRFEENRIRMRNNVLNLGGDESVGPARDGQGLLAGVLRCGRCGRKLHVRYWGKSGTAARYLCKGDFLAGGSYCLGFGGSTVDKRFSAELLAVISPLGIQASIIAMENDRDRSDEKQAALRRQLEEAEYEQRRAWEQYNEVDPRNRLVAAELERRWNEKLNTVEDLKVRLLAATQDEQQLTAEQSKTLFELGNDFSGVWDSGHCPVVMKKRMIRTVIEEVIVNLEEESNTLQFIIHWKGGSHTQFRMPKPVSGVGKKTAQEDLQIIGEMSGRYGDDEIARVLNKLGRSTAKGKRWSRQRVTTTRNRYAITGCERRNPDSEILSLGAAAQYCDVSQTSIKRLVAAGLLEKKQIAPWAPWEILRTDLDAVPIRRIVDKLKSTGKLDLEGNDLTVQQSLFQS